MVIRGSVIARGGCAKRVLYPAMHLVATADGRVAASGVHLVVLLLRKVSAIGRSFTGAGLCRQQVVVRRHLALRDAELGGAVPVIVVVRGGAGFGVEGAHVALRLELEVVRCALWQGSTKHAFSVHARETTEEGDAGSMCEVSCQQQVGRIACQGVPEPPRNRVVSGLDAVKIPSRARLNSANRYAGTSNRLLQAYSVADMKRRGG